MEMTTADTLEYATLFRSYVRQNLSYVLTTVPHVTVLDDETRVQWFHTLSYAFELPALWEVACTFLAAIAPLMERAGYREEWIAYLQDGIAKSHATANTHIEAQLRFHLGVLYQLQTQYAKACDTLLETLALYRRLEEPLGQGRVLNRLGYVARLMQAQERAHTYIQEALVLVADVTAEQAYSQLVLGTLAYDVRDWDTALRHFQTSLETWQKTQDRRMIAWAYTNLGTPLWALKRYDEATACYDAAIGIFAEVQDPLHQATAETNLGNIYLERTAYETALVYYARAEPVFVKLQDRWRLAAICNNQGMAYRLLARWDEAVEVYQRSIHFWRDLDNTKSLVNAMDGLALAYEGKGDIDLAQRCLRDALQAIEQLGDSTIYDFLYAKLRTHLEAITTMPQKRTLP